ncbi:alpha/beta-hydrolase [Delitschia confertaspora ATCC 74209]|uniref:Alpha/beta-hydrolase n=1 Tax=Delitschia confertaspora ATCC 74209 TaxID=1513339 RepID=A0A9P4MW01_9PLEO|nr:alpha/beta-hydrolase [Delitschia confertaspora ATCC 74209]
MDEEQFDGDECDMVLHYPDEPHQPQPESSSSQALNPVPQTPSTGTVSFAKVWLYSNSRLPPHMPPFKVYMPTYPLLCLAAKYSQRAYNRPTGAERDTHVPANWRHWTKAMVLKSLPIDSMNTVVVAIRGSQSFMDWAVNFRDAPKAPEGFLDDGGNLCHAGFLHVARQMIAPIANHLRALLLENPSRSNCSLLITGHSAGGAVAALLYAHMMSTTVQSELNRLAGFFKRIHCITFGAPPITLIPLQRPDGLRCRKSLFFSIINEGDLVARADSQVIKSLLALLAKPAPTFSLTKMTNKRPKPRPAWLVPPTTLSLAGRIVVLRERPGMRGEVNVEAVVASDEEMREVIYGDVLMHRMSLYVHRVEALSVSAVTVGEA